MSQCPIAEYALLSDCHGAALVDRNGSIDWLCLPRFDSPALFCRLLGEDTGSFALRPVGATEVRRGYLPGSLVLESRFRSAAGDEIAIVDALAVGANEHGHELGATSPHLLVREIHGLRGLMDVDIEYAPRPEYGLIVPLLYPADGGILARGGASVLRLSTRVPLTIDGGTARGRLRVPEGYRFEFALQHRSSAEPMPEPWRDGVISERLADTVRAWRSWSALHQSYDGPWKELVAQSGRVLQGLTYVPTGAIAAAATTSLPESAGGVRNWDYRYTWVRDASFTLEALWVAACPDEAHRFFDYMAHTALSQVQRSGDLQIMFGIGGEHDLSERELTHLAGWRRSTPVRIGNDAWRQRQLDVYGELMGAALRLRDQLGELQPVTRGFLCEVANLAARRWREKDQGIWESRGQPQHYLYSKLMCWAAVDRALELSELLAADPAQVAAWRAARDEIRRAILEQGYSDEAHAFTQAFGVAALDASALVLPIVGFLPADDPRMLSTLEAIEQHLTDERGLVYRYRGVDDGLEGDEGTFLLCTFWLAHARALAGQVERAREVFERAAAVVNDVGLLAEEVDPATGELLGNFPQAFSHIGLVNAAWAIYEAERRAAAPPLRQAG